MLNLRKMASGTSLFFIIMRKEVSETSQILLMLKESVSGTSQIFFILKESVSRTSLLLITTRKSVSETTDALPGLTSVLCFSMYIFARLHCRYGSSHLSTMQNYLHCSPSYCIVIILLFFAGSKVTVVRYVGATYGDDYGC